MPSDGGQMRRSSASEPRDVLGLNGRIAKRVAREVRSSFFDRDWDSVDRLLTVGKETRRV